MKVQIQPVQVFVSGSGLVTATQVEVRVQSLDLGTGATLSYELQVVDNTDPKSVKTKTIASGSNPLTPEQYAEWKDDDTYPAKCVVQNIGLTPVA